MMMKLLEQGIKQLGFSLNTEQLEQFEIYFQEILDWNRKLNLTSITEYEEVQVKHFLDSITLIQGIDMDILHNGCSIIDIGTGAGLPGIPLRIAFPNLKLTLLEATAKKTEFLKYVISTLNMDNVEIITGRAEEYARIGKYREAFDIVTARAVTQLSALAELTLPFCSIGGRCILPKKGDTQEEVKEAQKAIEVLGGNLTDIKNIEIEGLTDNRHLVILNKVTPTPDKYPRRPGMPEKRPIK